MDKIKEKRFFLSKAVREALKDWLDKEPVPASYNFLENALYKKMTKEGEKAWKELREVRGLGFTGKAAEEVEKNVYCSPLVKQKLRE